MDRGESRWTAAALGVTLLLVPACTRIGFSPGARPDRGPAFADQGPAPTDAAPADARPDNPWLGPFTVSDPEPLAAVNSSAGEMEPHLSPDGLTLYFASLRGYGDWEGYLSTRADRAAPFGAPVPNAAINTEGEETHFALSRDRLTAFVATDRPGGAGASDIWIGVRESPATPFTPADFAPLALINTPGHEYDPEPSADGLQLYYVTDGPAGGAGGQDIMVASRPASGAPFDALAPVPGVNSPESDDNPTLTADGLVIVFSSARAGRRGFKDLYYATRASADAPFDEPRPVPGLNTDDDDTETHISADGRELFFASDRPGGQGALDLYRVVIESGP